MVRQLSRGLRVRRRRNAGLDRPDDRFNLLDGDPSRPENNIPISIELDDGRFDADRAVAPVDDHVDAVSQLLELRNIRFRGSTVATRWADGRLELAGGGRLEADAVVALPKLQGPPIEGLPQDENGFVPTDELGWVLGLQDVYAAGDITQSPIKQGGIAAQQADAVASAIASDLGASVRPAEFTPVLRGLLLTGGPPRFLRADPGHSSVASTQPLWWPPGKIVGRHLSPFLAEQLGLRTDYAEPAADVAVAIDLPLDEFPDDGAPYRL